MNTPQLEFTGERFTPECVREIWYEHWHRYAFAQPLAKGRRVLDAACGEGYGSALLATVAQSVVGVDIEPSTVAHARARYGDRPNLSFEQSDASKLDALEDGSFDLIVSFETLEHLEQQEQLVGGFSRLLAPDGVLLLSTPDKRTYSDEPGYQNPFHVRELYRHEFEDLLTRHFAHHTLFAQRLMFHSVLWNLSGGDRVEVSMLNQAGTITQGIQGDPVYYVAVCSQSASSLQQLTSMHLFGDDVQSVYQHYNEEIRKGIAAGGRIAELEAEVERLKSKLAEASQ
ncbi:class I SAM-dependent methyltransferase [Pseudomarimonas arenosa]|uniref:Class I SAM-dependent methyltransferase n=1 Tax=Pseudomarimonas arenosa TaxID=2774145 RepID=A0AAW3ZKE7_9GAMM|nr:class I SAM-dependent methyltransferase [Pseudomarimonas arenosa]MBD8526438.1 class I SAM-dependent methyltransferase [Pseudomarimonas arenosa]